MTIELPVRFYSGAPAAAPRGLVTETWPLDLERTALIELHCWNIGFPGGVPVPPDYWVFMGSLQNHEAIAGFSRVVAAREWRVIDGAKTQAGALFESVERFDDGAVENDAGEQGSRFRQGPRRAAEILASMFQRQKREA